MQSKYSRPYRLSVFYALIIYKKIEVAEDTTKQQRTGPVRE